MKTLLTRCSAFAVLLLVLAGPGEARQVYAVREKTILTMFSLDIPFDPPDPLPWGVDTAIGDIGFEVSAIDFDPVSGVLYGVDVVNDQLLSIDTFSGAGDVVGALGVDVSPIQNTYVDMTFDGTGRLWLLARLAGAALESSSLLQVDVGTGAATLLGEIQTSEIWFGLFERNGQLFLTGERDFGPEASLAELHLPGLTVTELASLELLELRPIGVDYDPSNDVIVFLARPTVCPTFCADLIGYLTPPTYDVTEANLWVWDTFHPPYFEDIAVAPLGATAIPVLDARGLVLLTLVTALSGVFLAAQARAGR